MWALLQTLKNWIEKLEPVLEPLKGDLQIVYVYYSRQLLSKEGWEYALKRGDLLVVGRQTMPTYVPIAQERLAVSDLQLPPVE